LVLGGLGHGLLLGRVRSRVRSATRERAARYHGRCVSRRRCPGL